MFEMIKYDTKENIILEFIQYFLRPHYIKINLLPKIKYLKQLFVLLLVMYMTKMTWIFTINRYLHNHFEINRSEITDEQTLGTGLFMFFITAVIVAPLVEELLFRLFLKGKKIFWFLILGVTTGLVSYWLVKGIVIHLLIAKRTLLVTSFLLPLIVSLLLYFQLSTSKNLEKFSMNFFPVMFYFSVISFSWLHVFNYKWSGSFLIVLPFMIPHVLAGLTLGFARMKYGLWASILLHMCSNGLTFIFDKLLHL